MNSQESDPGGRGVAALCWVGEVKGEWQVTVVNGRQSLGRRRAQMLPSREGGHTGKTRGQMLPMPLPPAAPRPKRNSDGDKVPTNNHTHAKLWLIKRYFWKTTRFQISNLQLPLNVQKLKVFQLQEGLYLLVPWPGALPLNHVTSFYCTTTEYKSTFSPHKKYCLPVHWSLPPRCPPIFRFLAPANDNVTFRLGQDNQKRRQIPLPHEFWAVKKLSKNLLLWKFSSINAKSEADRIAMAKTRWKQ